MKLVSQNTESRTASISLYRDFKIVAGVDRWVQPMHLPSTISTFAITGSLIWTKFSGSMTPDPLASGHAPFLVESFARWWVRYIGNL